jgi:hypothetical protein
MEYMSPAPTCRKKEMQFPIGRFYFLEVRTANDAHVPCDSECCTPPSNGFDSKYILVPFIFNGAMLIYLKDRS